MDETLGTDKSLNWMQEFGKKIFPMKRIKKKGKKKLNEGLEQ